MALKVAKYEQVRKDIRPGDVIAFGGKGNFSDLIKWATRAAVSHVGIVLQSKLLVEDDRTKEGLAAQAGKIVQVIESTSLDDFSGVSISRLSDRIGAYQGEVWWLPLSSAVREKLDGKAYFNWLLHQNRKPYDVPQAVKSALDATDGAPLLGKLTLNTEDFSRFFCSELAAGALEAGGALTKVNASEITPIDLCMFQIYAADYYQLKGPEKAIRGYNSLDPTGWGQ